jgi:sugar phosphate isomerase/epimerase
MHLGIFAKTFPRPDLVETLDAIKAHGLTHIQFNMSCMGLPTLPDRLDEGSCVWIAQMLSERGLTMAAISGTFNTCDPVRSRVENNLRRLDVLAAACRWLDTRIITLCTGTLDREDMWRWNPENVRKSTWDELVQTMREAATIADRHEVTLAFEPELNNVVNSVMRARRLLDEVDSPWLKVVIDPANLVRPGELDRLPEILDEACDWLGPDIVLAHAKEPRIDELDQTALKEMKWRDLLNKTDDEEFARMLVEFMEETERKQELFRELHGVESLGTVADLFYWPYFWRLIKMKYDGAVIIHGLEEGDAERRIALLRKVLEGLHVKD